MMVTTLNMMPIQITTMIMNNGMVLSLILGGVPAAGGDQQSILASPPDPYHLSCRRRAFWFK